METTVEGYEIICCETLYLIVRHRGKYALYDDKNNSIVDGEWFKTFKEVGFFNAALESMALFSLSIDELDQVLDQVIDLNDCIGD